MKTWLALCLALALGGSAIAQSAPEAVEVTAAAIDRFDFRTPVGAAYGSLVFLGAMQLNSPNPDFGGLSGLRVDADGVGFTAISDRGSWFRGKIQYDGTRPTGLTDVTRSATPGRDGRPLAGRRGFDTEALEIDGRTAWVSAERVHWLTRYALDADGRPVGAGKAVGLPKEMARAPSNSGYEAMARLSSGAILMIAENHKDENGDNRAYVVGGKTPLTLSVRRSDDFSPTDMTRLPGSGLALLERRYKPPFSLSVRIRRIAETDIADGALVDGPTLMEASLVQRIDNFEAISAHRGADGRTVLTVLSDDNFVSFQRTILAQFALPD